MVYETIVDVIECTRSIPQCTEIRSVHPIITQLLENTHNALWRIPMRHQKMAHATESKTSNTTSVLYCNDEMFPYFFEQCIFLVYIQSQSKRNLFESLYLRISTDSGNFNPQKSLNAALPRQGRLFITYSTINRSSSVWLSIHLVCKPCRITLKIICC